ncbi:uncharacterized protein LOC111088227 isoform X2 [Limulus polyphemus]|uniref:Uncharacterized protein LOC111088227 isoform X2 n=1 Tax=Limulus polyphemus TaxID=6850 RepID=A0ABM1TBZ1_LIMPO|nr:uncharacterized protein LOC111088227 isoform X2 [Limulus polyphemus]
MKKRLVKNNDDESDQENHLSTKQSETESIACITGEHGSTAQQRNIYQKPAEELKIDVERLSIEPTTPSQKSPVTVQEWINSLHSGSEEENRCESEAQDVEEELPVLPPIEAAKKNTSANPNFFREHLPEGLCDDNLYLGAEARNLDGILQDAAFNRFANSVLPQSRRVTLGDTHNKQSSFNSDFSSFSGVSSFSSVESLLEARKEDPEELLLALGFGGQTGKDSVSRIPKRFFMEPSHARGVKVYNFLQQHENVLKKQDIGSWGFLGPSVSSYSQLSRRLSNIATANTVLGRLGNSDRHRKISSQSAMCWSDVKQTLRAATAFREGKLRHSSDSILDPANREFLQKQGIDEPLDKPKKVVIGLHTYCFSHEGDLIQGAFGTTDAETPFSTSSMKWKEKQMSALDEVDEENIRSLPEKDKKSLNETLEASTATSQESPDDSLVVSGNNDKKLCATKASSFPAPVSRRRLLSRQSNIEEDENSEDSKIADRIQLEKTHSNPDVEKKAVLLTSAENVSWNEQSNKPLEVQESDLSANSVRRPERLKVHNIQHKESFELEELSTTEGENSYVVECSRQHLNVDGLSGGSCLSDSSGFAEDVPTYGGARGNTDISLEEGFGKSQKEESEEMEDESKKCCSLHLTEQVKNQSGLNLDQATPHASSVPKNPDLGIGLQLNQEFRVPCQQFCADVTTQVTYSQSSPVVSVKCVPSLVPKSHPDTTVNVDVSVEHSTSSNTESEKLQMENLMPVKLLYPYLTSSSSYSSRDFKFGAIKLNDVSDVACQTSELGVFVTSENVGSSSSSYSNKGCQFGAVKLNDVSDVACQTGEMGVFVTSENVGSSSSSYSSKGCQFGAIKLNDVSDVACQTSELGVFVTSENAGSSSSSYSSKGCQFGAIQLNDVSDVACQTSESGVFETSQNVGTVNQLSQEPSNRELRNVQQEILHTLSMKQTLLELQNLRLALKHYKFAEQQQLASRTRTFQRLLSNMSRDQRACYQSLQDIRQDITEEVILMEELLLSLLSALCDVEPVSEFQNWDTRHLAEAVNKSSLQSQLERMVLIMNPSQTEPPKSVINSTSIGIVCQQPDSGELGWRVETTDQSESIVHVLNKESEDDVCQKPDQGELGWSVGTIDQPESTEHVLNKESECMFFKQPNMVYLDKRSKKTRQPECTLDTEVGSAFSQQAEPTAAAQEDLLENVLTRTEVEQEQLVKKGAPGSDVTVQNVHFSMGGSDYQPQQSNSSLSSVYANVVLEQPGVENLFQVNKEGTSDCIVNVTHGLNGDEQHEFEQNRQKIDSEQIHQRKCI